MLSDAVKRWHEGLLAFQNWICGAKDTGVLGWPTPVSGAARHWNVAIEYCQIQLIQHQSAGCPINSCKDTGVKFKPRPPLLVWSLKPIWPQRIWKSHALCFVSCLEFDQHHLDSGWYLYVFLQGVLDDIQVFHVQAEAYAYQFRSRKAWQTTGKIARWCMPVGLASVPGRKHLCKSLAKIAYDGEGTSGIF